MSTILDELIPSEIIISIIIPVYNCSQFIDECFQSIFLQQLQLTPKDASNNSLDLASDSLQIQKEARNQEGSPNNELKSDKDVCSNRLHLEISIFEDGSTDGTSEIVDKWIEKFHIIPNDFSVQIKRNNTGAPKGVGYGRNRAIEQSHGKYLCFCDADDIMEPNRIITQYCLAVKHPNALIGSRLKRLPEDSTKNFTHWANNLTEKQLGTQVYLTFGPTILMPTWFCSRNVYERILRGFDENGKGTPEDLIFFYKHLDDPEGEVVRADEVLMTYRYHPSATTFSVSDAKILKIRLERLESVVLSKWTKFTIWNAGKKGRQLYRSLKPETQKKVVAFCDVDEKKLKQKTYHPYPLDTKVPIVHPNDASSPFIVCVKTELIWDADGAFRKILDSLDIIEGKDFVYFN